MLDHVITRQNVGHCCRPRVVRVTHQNTEGKVYRLILQENCYLIVHCRYDCTSSVEVLQKKKIAN